MFLFEMLFLGRFLGGNVWKMFFGFISFSWVP